MTQSLTTCDPLPHAHGACSQAAIVEDASTQLTDLPIHMLCEVLNRTLHGDESDLSTWLRLSNVCRCARVGPTVGFSSNQQSADHLKQALLLHEYAPLCMEEYSRRGTLSLLGDLWETQSLSF